MTIHSLDRNLRLYEMPVQYRDRPKGSHSKLNTVGDGIRVLSTIFRMIREYKPLPFFGGCGLLIDLVGFGFLLSVMIEFWQSGSVPRIPTLIGSVLLILVGLLSIIAGIVLDVLAKNDRRAYIHTSNLFAYLHRHQREHKVNHSEQ